MSEHDKKNPSEQGLDLSEYIPGHDLTEDRELEPGMDEAQRKELRRRAALRKRLLRAIPAVILAILILSVVADVHAEMPIVAQYIFLYFLFEAVFAENWIVLGLSFGMLACFGVFMAGYLSLLPFMGLTFVSLILFLRCEKRIWLQVMNILVLGTWGLMMIFVFLFDGRAPR
ncbi:MAG: hypothetical protein IKO02_03760 [Lentisphaeria bacterium]|nr:hypothetical protein [Lentisphaeria bacterium]